MRRAPVIFAALLIALAGCGGNAPTETPPSTATTADGPTVAPQNATDSTDARTAEANERRTTAGRAAESAAPDERPERSTPPNAEADATASPTPTPTPTSTPSATPTPTPTSTPTPTPTSTPTPRTEWTVTVAEVVDGDTFEVRFPDGHTENVRLLGVDTPEVHVENDPAEFEGVPNTEAGHDWLRDWGHKASEFARTTVAGERIRIVTDPAADRRGSYGRLLVYAYRDGGRSFNRRLLERGYARLYESEFSERSAFASVEATARRNGVGLWNYEESTSGPTPTPTPTRAPDGGEDAVGSAGSGRLAVAEMHADAPGNDHDNLEEEYVVLRNAGEEPIDLNGWTVSDGADHAYTFEDVTLAPGESLTLYTGSGAGSETNVYWGSETAVWNNGGDTVIVTTDDGETVLRREY